MVSHNLTLTINFREIEPTPQNKRAVLGNALYMIRIPTMTLEEFANGAAQKGILTQQETIDIFFHFTANNKPTLQYPIKPRAGLKSQVKVNAVFKMRHVVNMVVCRYATVSNHARTAQTSGVTEVVAIAFSSQLIEGYL